VRDAPDIFLSYSREDQARARLFAEGFEREGFSVWWDQTLHSGENYDQVTERALRAAKAVVVLWSKHSVESRWVRAEATQADRLGTLVPAMLEECTRPIMFELKHTAELAHWQGDAKDPAWRQFVQDLRHFAGGTAQQREPPPSPPPRSPAAGARLGGRWVALIAAVSALLLGLLVWSGWRGDSGHAVAPGSVGPEVTSLAVLPFANRSSDPEQEYFSDGLTEEILNQLAQINGLRLVGPTSSFAFKGRNEDPRVMAEELGVANLLEGSISKDGTSLRIRAQLIRGSDGTQLLSKAYDRELSNVFTLQEEVAKDVAQALSVRLDVGSLPRVEGGTTSVEAYDRYLRARRLVIQGGREASAEAAQLLREAVDIDGGFSRAWLELASALGAEMGASVGLTPAEAAPLLEDAALATNRGIQLAPESRGARVAKARQHLALRQWAEADRMSEELMRAYPLTAENLEVAMLRADVGFVLGRVGESIGVLRQIQQLEPLSRGLSTSLQTSLYVAGRFDEAQREYERGRNFLGNPQRADWNALLYMLARGDADAEAIRRQGRLVQADENVTMPFSAAGAVARQAAADPAYQDLVRTAILSALADALGDTQLALDRQRKVVLQDGFVVGLWILPYSGVRSDPGFKDLLRQTGLADYFRSSGKWGDFCKQVGSDDFECR
jgi:TolB-like protein/tetratricopeptide (TPR) repeat protein